MSTASSSTRSERDERVFAAAFGLMDSHQDGEAVAAFIRARAILHRYGGGFRRMLERLKEAIENIVERRITMELSMTIVITAAATIGEFFTALVITLFVLVAEVLEGLTVGRGRKAIRDLLEFLPREVSVRRAGSVQSVAAEELSVGDAVLVAPGGRIPVDGGRTIRPFLRR
jgi:cation transport ATPase